MEVADEIVVMAQGRVEQIGSPDDLYERPANDFVMSFLGPVTRLGGALVRPHDVQLFGEADGLTVPATVVRVVRLGFEVRVEVVGDGIDAWAQLTRDEAQRLEIVPGAIVHVRAAARGVLTAADVVRASA